MSSSKTLPTAARQGVTLLCALCASFVGGAGTARAADASASQQHFAAVVRPLLEKHCRQCHTGEEPKGGFHLNRLSADFADEKVRRTWQVVFEQLHAGSMPPEDKLQPTAQQRKLLSDWIAQQLAGAESAQRASQGRTVLRRLNRIEYENTLRDLLGVPVSIKHLLPEDGSADGFDNAGAALHTSSFLMERYLEAAEAALDMAIANRPQPALIEKRISLADCHQVKVTRERVFRHLDDAVVCLCSSIWQTVQINGFYPPDGGLYRFRISAYAYNNDGKPVTFRVTHSRAQLMGKNGLIGYFDAPPDKPAVFEFVQYMEPRTTIAILPYGLPSAQTVGRMGGENYEGPGLAVQWVEVQGPLHDSWPPESHRRLFGDLEQRSAPGYNARNRVEVFSEQPLVDAHRILHKFCRRAFRRSVSDDDIRPYVQIVEARMAGGATFEEAVRAALKGVLLSPEFVFLREAPGKLDDFAVASRLSYFLWSTMPDEELLSLAEQKKLSQPATLRAQVERMLQDPRASAFTENFVGQWLALREIDFTEPSHLLYPEFDHMLKVSMIREAELFFEEVLRNDLSVTNFIDSDFTMLNGRLARHYGIPGPDGWEFRKTPLPPGSHRGGVLTMAGVLKVTANGTTTSPVLRGAWVLDRILGTPPSPPPPDVGALDPDIRGATTIREQLEKHRSVSSCASCHARIDPPGFALESFDCIGGWRERYRVTGNGDPVEIDGRRMSYRHGKPVDPSGVMPDGRSFSNIDEFKQLLLEDKDQIARALAVKVATYATGAAPGPADREELEAILQRIRQQNYGFRSLVHEIVQSKLFLQK